MTTKTTSMNPQQARLEPAVQRSEASRRGRYWPWALAGSLIVNAAAVGTLIVFSSSSATHSVEPDYYAKATKWDATMAQERINIALGWHIRARAVVTRDAVMELTVRLEDSQRAPLEGAIVQLEAFHNARSSARVNVALTEGEPGAYKAVWGSSRLGLWQLRFDVSRGDQHFTATVVADVASAADSENHEDGQAP